MSALLRVCCAVCKELNQNRAGLFFPPSAWVLQSGCLKALWVLKSKSHSRPRPQPGLSYCSVWVLQWECVTSMINTAFWQGVLHPDWKKPLVNAMTVCHLLITLAFHTAMRCFLGMKLERGDAQTPCATARGTGLASGSQEQSPSSCACRAGEGQGMGVFIDLCGYCGGCGAALCHGGICSLSAQCCIPAVSSSGLFVTVALSEPWETLSCKILGCYQQLATPEAGIT